jgi:hypothetical protein
VPPYWSVPVSVCGDGLRCLPADHLGYDPLSTNWRQTGILVDVHPVS